MKIKLNLTFVKSPPVSHGHKFKHSSNFELNLDRWIQDSHENGDNPQDVQRPYVLPISTKTPKILLDTHFLRICNDVSVAQRQQEVLTYEFITVYLGQCHLYTPTVSKSHVILTKC